MLGNCPRKRSENGKFPSHCKLAQSIVKRKFPSVDKPLRIWAPPKISPSRRTFEKYKPRGLYSEFYGIIGNQLSWISHIKLICRSFGQKVKQDSLRSIYFTSIIPAVTCCNLVWGTCSPTLLDEVEHIHTRAAKIIYRLSDISNQEAITIAGCGNRLFPCTRVS